ncbi:DUF885 domain-containing protein [Pseudonocardia acaciae]|uniref:DUF885 domain-containing protein n=1 Tax=Pseudonocardia acaciae TaxID=551276 RepID=UPI000490A404|nr:DUF885 domain-containing protein [Pseudonocardia acaciae]
MTTPVTTAGDVADRLLAELEPVDPAAAEALGREPYVVMPALAPEDFGRRRDAWQRALASVRGSTDGVLGLALQERLRSELAMDDAGFTRALLAPLATPVHQVREVFDNLPHVTPDDWQRVGEHLRLVPAALADYAATLREAQAAGHVVARRQVFAVAEQCERWVGRDDFYRGLVGPEPGLASAAADATAATAAFAEFLRTELLPRARASDGVGRELYGVTARAFLGDDVDLEETYAFGWDELARLTAEMSSVASELGAGSLDQAAAALDADPSARLSAPDELLAWLQGRVDEVVDAVDGVHFDLPPVARRPECRLSTTTTGVMYYTAPDPSFSRPGRVWWSPPADGTSFPWRAVTTVHHEAVPGHHLQICVAMAEPSLHPWQRSMAHVHGYVEGWAHYAERLTDELGLLRTPGERLGMLYGQRWRAARIVIDMGLHLGLPIPAGNGLTKATRWTPELGVEVLQKAAGADAATARFEVDRYLGWPAQALAFRVGARLWRQVRAEAERAPGFDLKDFHMRALRLGPMGLGPLRAVLTR